MVAWYCAECALPDPLLFHSALTQVRSQMIDSEQEVRIRVPFNDEIQGPGAKCASHGSMVNVLSEGTLFTPRPGTIHIDPFNKRKHSVRCSVSCHRLTPSSTAATDSLWKARGRFSRRRRRSREHCKA